MKFEKAADNCLPISLKIPIFLLYDFDMLNLIH